MARNTYDAKCFYGGKMVGRCTIADAEEFELFMNQCGTASNVLRQYAYFSDELAHILANCVRMESNVGGVLGTARIEIRF